MLEPTNTPILDLTPDKKNRLRISLRKGALERIKTTGNTWVKSFSGKWHSTSKLSILKARKLELKTEIEELEEQISCR